MTGLQQARDVAASGASGLGRGVVATPGLVGDLILLGKYSPAFGGYIADKVREWTGSAPAGAANERFTGNMSAVQSGLSEAERSGRYGELFGRQIPAGKFFVDKAANYVPGLNYQPRTGAGRGASTIGEFLGSSLTTRGLAGGIKGGLSGGARGGVGGAASAAASKPALATDIGAGAGSAVASEHYKDSPAQPIMGLLGAIPGAMAGRAAYGRLSSSAALDRGERIAGDVVRGQLGDPAAARAKLDVKPGEYVDGVRPTSPQLLRNESGVSGLASELRAGKTKGAESTAIRMENSDTALRNAGDAAIGLAEQRRPFTGMAEALDLPPGMNPKGAVSSEAQALFRAVEEPLFKAAEQAWKHPAFKSAVYDKNAVVRAIDDAIKGMGISRLGLPKEMTDYIREIRNYGSSGIPFEEVQKLKRLANQIARDPSVRDRSGAVGITTKLDDVLTDPSKLVGKLPPGVNAPQAFDAARNATRQYKSIFDTDNVGPFSERMPKGSTQAGQYAMPPEQMLDALLGNPNTALERFRELQKIPGLDLSAPVSKWVVSHISNNGTKAAITPDDVSRFLRSPSYSAIVDEVPGLRRRLNAIANQSVNEQVRSSLASALESPDPSRLGQYISKNRQSLDQVFSSAGERQFISALERSSKALARVPGGDLRDRAVFDRLMKGDLFTILHGKVTGKFSEAAAGAAAGKAAGVAAPVMAGLEIVTAGAVSSGFFPGVRTILSNIVYGATREQALQALNKAMTDPAYMKLLLSKPTAENSMKVLNSLAPFAAQQAGTRGVLGSRDLNPRPEPEATDAAYERLVREGKINSGPRPLTIPGGQRASGGRVERASGGRVRISDRLMVAVERARREVQAQTKPILNAPDETVVRALKVAQQHI